MNQQFSEYSEVSVIALRYRHDKYELKGRKLGVKSIKGSCALPGHR